MVFFHHECTILPVSESPFFNRIAAELHVGVTLFFVLSGFVITYQYQDRLGRSFSAFKEFIRKRFIRIFPTYWTVCLLAIAVDFARGGPTNGFIYWAFQFTLIKSFFEQAKFSGISQSWSLAVEECFYWIAPFLFLLKGRKIFAGLLLIYAAGAFIGYLSIQGAWPDEMRSIGFMFPIPFIIVYTFFGRVFEFFCGMLLARKILASPQAPEKSNHSAWPRFTMLGSFAFSLCLFGLVSVQGRNIGMISPSGAAINNLLMPIGIALLLYGLTVERSFFSKILSTSIFLLLGRASYSFYLLSHGDVAEFVSEQLGGLSLVPKFIALNILAIAFHLLLEKRLFSRLKKQKTPAQRAEVLA